MKSSRKKQGMMASILCVVFGLAVLLKPQGSLDTICQLLGWILVIAAVIGLVYAFLDRSRQRTLEARITLWGGSIIALILGAVVLSLPAFFGRVLPSIIGLILLANGIINLVQAGALKNASGQWTGSMITAALTVILGIIVLFNARQAGSMMIRLIGAALIYNGLSNIYVNNKFGDDMRNPL